MRQALNNAQATQAGFGLISQENVFKVCDQPHPLFVKEALRELHRRRASRLGLGSGFGFGFGLGLANPNMANPNPNPNPNLTTSRRPTPSSSNWSAGYCGLDIVGTFFRIVKPVDSAAALTSGSAAAATHATAIGQGAPPSYAVAADPSEPPASPPKAAPRLSLRPNPLDLELSPMPLTHSRSRDPPISSMPLLSYTGIVKFQPMDEGSSSTSSRRSRTRTRTRTLTLTLTLT